MEQEIIIMQREKLRDLASMILGMKQQIIQMEKIIKELRMLNLKCKEVKS